MAAMARKIDPHCRAFQNAVDLLARPWTGLILILLQNGPLRFSELEEGSNGVGAKTLSARLKDLENSRAERHTAQLLEVKASPGYPLTLITIFPK